MSDDSDQLRPISPREKSMYQHEYQHGADLFQRALQQHAKSNDLYQKGEFEDVMENMLQVLNETARALKENQLQNQNEKIAQDYAAYQQSPSLSTQEQLKKDLEQAKHLF